MSVSEIASSMIAILGDAFTTGALFVSMMLVGGLLGRLSGGFKNMNFATLFDVFVIVGIASAVVGSRFADEGIWLMVSLLTAALMWAAFVLVAIITPARQRSPELPVVCHNPVGQHTDFRV
jgi:hypothetical protein